MILKHGIDVNTGSGFPWALLSQHYASCETSGPLVRRSNPEKFHYRS